MANRTTCEVSLAAMLLTACCLAGCLALETPGHFDAGGAQSPDTNGTRTTADAGVEPGDELEASSPQPPRRDDAGQAPVRADVDAAAMPADARSPLPAATPDAERPRTEAPTPDRADDTVEARTPSSKRDAGVAAEPESPFAPQPPGPDGYPPLCEFQHPDGGMQPFVSPHSVHTQVHLWRIAPGSRLVRGAVCQIGNARLQMQPDGDLVLYDELAEVRWRASKEHSHVRGSSANDPGHYADFQIDHNFVVYDARGAPLWSSNEFSDVCCGTLGVQEDGNLVVYDRRDVAIWKTNTYHQRRPLPPSQPPEPLPQPVLAEQAE